MREVLWEHPSPVGDELRALIKAADNESFAETRSIFTVSAGVRQRLLDYNGIDSKVLTPPVNDPELFTGGKMGDYLFAGGKINGMKRQHLLLEAMSQADSNIKLLIAGPPDTTADGEKLQQAVVQLGLEDRVSLDLRRLPRATYAQYVNEAAAVACIPVNEELGHVAMEAALAGKALLTTSDSVGILSLVKHEETGWIAQANPSSLAEAMNSVWKNPARTQQYGLAARELWLSLGINWPQTVEALLQ